MARRKNVERVMIVDEAEAAPAESTASNGSELVESMAMVFAPVAAAGATTLAIVHGSPRIGLREDYLAWGAAAVGLVAALKTTGVLHEAAVGVAAAGASVAVVRLLERQQQGRRERNAQVEDVDAAREEFKAEVARIDGILLQLAQSIAAQAEQQREWNRQQRERDAAMSGALRDLAMAINRNARDAQPSTVVEASPPAVENRPMFAAEEMLPVEFQATEPVSAADEPPIEHVENLPPNAVTLAEQPSNSAQLPIEVATKLDEIRMRLTDEERVRLGHMLSDLPPDVLQRANDHLLTFSTAEDAVGFIRASLLQRAA
jgi:hypothetical protein